MNEHVQNGFGFLFFLTTLQYGFSNKTKNPRLSSDCNYDSIEEVAFFSGLGTLSFVGRLSSFKLFIIIKKG